MASVTSTDFKLSVLLTSITGIQLDISPLVQQLNIYQDMFAPCMTGNVTLDDAANLFDTLPIAGYEKLNITITTIDNGTPIDFAHEFRVFAIENYQIVKQNHKTYTIKFASPAAYANRTKVFYNCTHLNTNEAIMPILQGMGITGDQLLIKDIDGLMQRPMIFGYRKPFSILKTILNKSLGNGKNATYVFFETKKNFVLDSITNIITNTAQPTRTYNYAPASIDINSRYSKDRIFSFRIPHVFNRLEHETSGARSIDIITHDMPHKTQTTFSYQYDDKFGENKHMEVNSFISKTEDATLTHRVLLSANNTTLNAIDDITNYPQEVHSRRTNQIMNLNTIKIIADVPGDLFNELGDIITFNLPNRIDNTPEIDKHKYLSGLYMITAIHHVVNMEEYQQVLELTKNSLPETLQTNDTTDSITMDDNNNTPLQFTITRYRVVADNSIYHTVSNTDETITIDGRFKSMGDAIKAVESATANLNIGYNIISNPKPIDV